MRAALVNAGNEYGGGREHIISLINELGRDQVDLIVFEEGPVAKAAREAGISVHVFQQKHRYEVKVLYRLHPVYPKTELRSHTHTRAKGEYADRSYKSILPRELDHDGAQ
ncbi:MAG: hypothetical protein U5K84_05105 [Alkalibacterium sp.]|nr:hypothetical protein [Alkalibacterium sp.]